MKIYSIYDPEFAAYGKVLGQYDTAQLVGAMEKIAYPEQGVSYEASIASLEACKIVDDFSKRAYGGMPVQTGMCWGHNTKLNCLEYHKDSELNIGTGEFILLLAREDDIIEEKLDTAKVKAFRAPEGVCVEVYATTLHYAPCQAAPQEGFRVAIVLPKGTNTGLPEFTPGNFEDSLLWARNKWLIAHEESDEAKQGAYTGLTGENIDIKDLIK